MLTEKQRNRFFSKIEKQENGCWFWKAHKDQGYGIIWVDNKKWRAHRLSYLQHYGEIKDGMFVCHKCDNPSCVNPDHLFLGSHKDNMKDMVDKNRSLNQMGENNNSSKINEIDVVKILSLLPIMNNTQISKEFNGRISHSMISNIRLGKNWSHITGIQKENVKKYSSLTKGI